MQEYIETIIAAGIILGSTYSGKILWASLLRKSSFASIREETYDKKFLSYPFPVDLIYKASKLGNFITFSK
jgi:hypothetical protein